MTLSKIINTENLQPQTCPIDLVEEESRVLDKAFIFEHSEIIQGSLPLDMDKCLVTPAIEHRNTHTFSLAEMMNKDDRGFGRRSQ